MMLNVLGQKMCILNSAKVADDLLKKRQEIYSDRPAMTMIKDLMGWNFNMGFQSYDAEYKKSRKLFEQGFSARASDSYKRIQLVSGKLLQTPKDFERHLRETTGAIIMKIAIGYDTVENDEFVRIAEEAQLAMVSAAQPGAYLVDVIPILKYVPEWFPGAGFKTVARKGWELAQDLRNQPFAWAKQRFVEGNARPSFFKMLMEVLDPDIEENETLIKDNVAVMYATGADTILSSILTFYLAMLHSPDVQKTAQEELDRVIGGRLPTFTDRDSLPFISCIVKETYRWEQVIPMGVPHRLMRDDTYDGYFIPKGTIMIPNHWGISHDKELYDDPMSFNPNRFMNPDGKNGPRDPNTIAFGWGRRICPGRFLAENQLWLLVATTLACFNITTTHDMNGKPIIPPRDYTSGLASRPKPFLCDITPRNDNVRDLIKHSVASLEA
ncbi:cytochrome P450 [Flagelloscypha sp. PMI_526]|nr:cytochrome P450 [Flagelloscypha sp. PMI_526]